MKRILISFISGLVLCAPAFSQDIPWFILPEDDYQGAIDFDTENPLIAYVRFDAPFFYEAIFGYAAAMYLNTLTVSGYFEEAKKVAKMFLRLQNDDGSISGVNRSNGIKARHPKGKAIRRVELDGRPLTSFDSEIITLPGDIADCTVAVYYK